MNIYDYYDDEQSYELENLEQIKINNSVFQSTYEELLYYNDYKIMKNNSIGKNSKGNNSIENNSNILKINSIGNNSIENNNIMLKNSSIENNNNMLKNSSIENDTLGNKLIENIIIENKKDILKINSIGNNSIEKISIENKSMENNSIENNKNHEKIQFLNKKRGRHNKYSTDNIFRRINVHYLKFLILFLNEVLKILKIEGEFKDINYSFKRNLNKTKFSQIKKEALIYFLQLDNNGKYKNKNFNKKLYTQIENNCKNNCGNYMVLNKLMSKSFIEIFKDIYIKNKKDIIFEGLTLHIHKNFDDFLENEDVKGDELYKKKILEVVRKSYLEYIFDIQGYGSPQ